MPMLAIALADVALRIATIACMSRRVRRAVWIDRLRSAVSVAVVVGVLVATAWRYADRGRDEERGWNAASGQVERVVDGDTLLLASGRRVRLLGVDTPETKHPTRPPEPWGDEASAFTRRLVEGRRVRLEYDVQIRDRYGRMLAWVWADDTLLNRALVEAGLSPAVLLSPLRPDYRRSLIEAEREARAAGRGIWSDQPAE